MSQHGFILVEETEIAEVASTVRLWRHTVTGAELLSFINSDENKVFGVSFRTPPSDSTGVAHILEHSVLCGSERFPVKEPFVELLKGSLQTFLNAFTYPDKTCYPVASTNTQDFYNLMDVYLDAVFFPIIDENIFRQEGWHIDAESSDSPWAYKGVVYNEMKGVYSSPDSVLAEQSQQSLFQDHVYGLDSGGSPEHILELSYEQFKEFHTQYYHPCNARFFFWGDDKEEERLMRVGAVLARFDSSTVSSSVASMPTRDVPLRLDVPFAASADETRGMVTVNWLLNETSDVEQNFALHMLEHILLAMPGSPLRRALIESGLGEDITGCGLEAELKQMYFSVGLKGIAPTTASDVETLIMETLHTLVEEGIEPQAIEAAYNSVEFSLRENNTGRFPRGLAVMLRSLTTWLYDGDPFALLRFEEPLKAIAQRVASGERYFESLIQHCLLDNMHRSTVCLIPDATLSEKRAEKEAERIGRIQSMLRAEERTAVVELAKTLRQQQEREDSPEALATIPGLTLEDMPKENRKLPLKIESAPTAFPILCHNVETSGIVYVELLFSLCSVRAELLPLVPLFGRALLEMGTASRSFVELGIDIAGKTGGIDADALCVTRGDTREAQAYLAVSGKATVEKVEELVRLFQEILLDARFDNQERFTRMVLEEKARLEQSLIPSGHGIVSSRLRAHYSHAGWLDEETGGVSYLMALRGLLERLAVDWQSVLNDLEDIRRAVVRREGALCNLTVEAAATAGIIPLMESLGTKLPSLSLASCCCAHEKKSFPHGEALIVPAQVNYVGKGANLYDLGYSYHGSCNVILKHLRMAFLWDRVRVQGGAYGAFCAFERMSGVFTQVSYRDPNISRTLRVYDKAADYLRTISLSERELTSAIVGAVGEIDSYLLPDAKGHVSLLRYLEHDNEDARQQMRDEVLSTTQQHFRQFADVLDAVARTGAIVVLGGAALTEEASSQDWKQVILV